MKLFHKNMLVAVFYAFALSLIACSGGGGNEGQGGNPTTDTTAPIATRTLNDGDIIGPIQTISIVFDESMDTSSLSLAGSMSTESNGGVWTMTDSQNDTLNISPSLSWSQGTNLDITINARDVAGNPVATIAMTLGVDAMAPQLTALPPTGSTIGGNTILVVTFNESVNPSSLILGGVLNLDVISVSWSSVSNANDTLTLSPASNWSEGIDRVLNISVDDIYGNSLLLGELFYTVDYLLPTAVVTPSNDSVLSLNQSITLLFDASMNPATLILSGDLATSSDGGVWSLTNVANDTLTIVANTTWPNAVAQTLIVDVDSNLTNPISTLTLLYDVNTLHVSNTGLISNPGTQTRPLLSINNALTRATTNNIKFIRIQTGQYSELVDMKSGVNIRGGYDATWNYDVTNIVTILGGLSTDGGYMALKIHETTEPTSLSTLRLEAPDVSSINSTSGVSVYGIHVVNSSALSLDNISIVRGNAKNGGSGTNGVSSTGLPADQGSIGTNGLQDSRLCDDSTTGIGGDGGGVGNRAGGGGGDGGVMDTLCTSGFPSKPNAQSGDIGGAANISVITQYGFGGSPGRPCFGGGPGASGRVIHGSVGLRGSALSGLFTGFYWSIPQNVDSNGSLGEDGSGGGGGGGSGGCDTGTDSYGAGGGGGGQGGQRAATAGTGGGEGGSSFGLFSINSVIQLNAVSIEAGQGGDGGIGGTIGTGQPGGAGRRGGFGTANTSDGGFGGDGGDGGNSGAGGGGAGGSVYGVYATGSTLTETTTVNISGGSAGSGGVAGDNPATASSQGDSGQIIDRLIE